MDVLGLSFGQLGAFFLPRAALVAENLALRQQLAIAQVSAQRPKLRKHDRIVWVWLSCIWAGWRSCLLIVKPETVTGWHRQGVRLYWRLKSPERAGRNRIDADVRRLIRRMSLERPLWGVPRIQSELVMLAHDAAESTVATYMDHRRKRPARTWPTFLRNHAPDVAAIDFFVRATVRFRLRYCFIVLHQDRRLVQFNVTPYSADTHYPAMAATDRAVVRPFQQDSRLCVACDRSAVRIGAWRQKWPWR